MYDELRVYIYIIYCNIHLGKCNKLYTNVEIITNYVQAWIWNLIQLTMLHLCIVLFSIYIVYTRLYIFFRIL